MKAARALWLGGALCLGGIVVGTHFRAPAVAPAAADPATSADAQADSRLVAGFTDFAGSESNARSLVSGLRQGGEIVLKSAPDAGGNAAAGTRFSLPTRPMDYGNSRTSLILAREQLMQLGIKQPTPVQIKAALTGGAVTSRGAARTTAVLLPGVLQMRAHGMGWGKIADSMGIKLGDAMDDRKGAPAKAVAASVPAASGIASSAVTLTGAQFEASKQVRAGAIPEPASRIAIRPARNVRSAPTAVTAPADAKPADSVTRRAPRAPAPIDPALTTARAAEGGAATAGAGSGPPSSGLSQELRSTGSGTSVANENRITGAAAAAAQQVQVPEPVALTPAARLEAPVPAAGERAPEPTSPAD